MSRQDAQQLIAGDRVVCEDCDAIGFVQERHPSGVLVKFDGTVEVFLRFDVEAAWFGLIKRPICAAHRSAA